MPSARTLSTCLALPLALAACGDDAATSATSTSGSTTSATAGTTTATSTSASTSAAATETGSGSGSASSTSGTGTTDTGTSTTGTTGVASTGSTANPCLCAPGEPSGACQGADLEVCADDCQGFVAEPCPMGQSCKDGACVALLCTPGAKSCADDKSYQVCADDGQSYGDPVPCGPGESCDGGACYSACDLVKQNPSSIGCSFFANRMDNFNFGDTDSLVVGNISKTDAAKVQLYFTPNGSNVEQAQGGLVTINPSGTYTFPLTNASIDKVSQLRVGGSYRVESDIPVIAYQHSPIGAVATNDASMLLPEHALKQNYVVASWKDVHSAYPSYFNVIAVEANTTVKWTPPQNTVAGAGVPAVNAGQTGQVMMNRFDTLQVRAPAGGDLSGTIIEADKPIWVVGAVECSNVPNLSCLYCDHMEEQMLPLDYWGKEYVGAHSPKRGSEKHHWRVFAGEDNTTVTTEPPQPGTPIVLAKKGAYQDLQVANNTSFVFKGDKPFLPVQYLESEQCGAGTGDPAMYQMIPVEQFLPSYAFATGTGYTPDYVQVIRQKGAADVTVDGATVTGYYTVGNYEVADWKINTGSHFAESAAPFGIISVGYTGVTSYAYPGGLRLEVINPQ